MIKSIGLTVVLVLAVIYVVAFFVPIEPDEQRPGTHLSGTLVTSPAVDWSFMRDRQLLQLQTNTWYGIPHSVTTTSFVRDKELYVPCGWCEGKTWPKNVARNPRVLVKVGGNLYPRNAVKVEDAHTLKRVLGEGYLERPDVALYHLTAVSP